MLTNNQALMSVSKQRESQTEMGVRAAPTQTVSGRKILALSMRAHG
jgi:hypothetical protein